MTLYRLYADDRVVHEDDFEEEDNSQPYYDDYSVHGVPEGTEDIHMREDSVPQPIIDYIKEHLASTPSADKQTLNPHRYTYIQGTCETSPDSNVEYTIDMSCEKCGDTLRNVELRIVKGERRYVYKGFFAKELLGCSVREPGEKLGVAKPLNNCGNCKNEPTCRFKAEGATKDHCNFFIPVVAEGLGPYPVDVPLMKEQRNFLCELLGAGPAMEDRLLELNPGASSLLSGIVDYLDHRLDVVEGVTKNFKEVPSE